MAAPSTSSAPRTITVEVAGLRRRFAVREALDDDHVERLAEVLDRCPPIVVSTDGHIVDGEHRVEAARRRGIGRLAAVVLSGDADAEIVEAIRSNTRHGLPLTRAERRKGAAAVLAARPDLSDRAVARICGVARTVVASVREDDRRSRGQNSHLNGRTGADGKTYGRLPDGWRRHLEALLRIRPEASVRELASLTGASVGAVQRYRPDLLARVENEWILTRWWRRLRARWYLHNVPM